LVVKDTKGAVFGALITEHLKIGEKEKYYGNGTIAVWSFATGSLQVIIVIFFDRCIFFILAEIRFKYTFTLFVFAVLSVELQKLVLLDHL
jgi:hypothetical protein